MTARDKEKDYQDLLRLLQEKETYIDYLENLTLAQANVLNLSEEERKNADKTIRAYQHLQQAAERELKEKDNLIRAHESLMNLSSSELLEKNAIFHNILEINQYISTIIEEEIVLKKTVENLIRAIKFDRGVLYLNESGTLLPKAFFNLRPEDLDGEAFRFSAGIIKRLTEEKKRIHLKNERVLVGGTQVRLSLLAIPLLAKGKLVGAIYADILDRNCAFTDHDLEVAEIFSTQALISINNVILYRILKHDAITDRFTGLPNRKKLEIDAELPGNKLLALINIDSFSSINTAYGLEVGNHVLKELALRLKMILPDHSTLYRLSGDEFVILSRTDTVTPHMLSAGIMNAASGTPIVCEDISINLSISVGLVQNEEKNLLRKADIALKLAKKRGHGYAELYRSEQDFVNRYKEVFVWVNKVKEAVEHNRLLPYFQGIRNNLTGKIEKYECLVRIVDAGKVLSPRKFLGPAKQVGLYSTVTFRMIDKCFAFFSDKPHEFALNLSYEDFCNLTLIEYITDKLKEFSIEPERVIFEVLEETSQKRDTLAFEFITALKALGVKIAIDDFGTEYSNFSRVLSVQADYLKIAGSFTKNILTDSQSLKIVKAITDFGHSIGTTVIAEHVSCQKIQDKIMELGIDYSQGNLFSKAGPTLI
ncbi:MAG TPA: EAL domain-containing protein [Desulfobacteraceae bacterium]|nr:EAL domain-containing protein [Desulfobacteraceae bacterium]